MENMLSIRGLNKAYPTFSLTDIDLDIPTGCIMGLVGQNGAGKSTLLKTIFQLLPADRGQITFDGKPMSAYGKNYKELIGYVSEEQQFYSNFTIAWHLKFASSFYSNWDHDLCSKMVRQFSLDPTKKVKDLSKGMQVKLALLIGLSHHAKLLLLDEPTSGLDPIVRGELLELMQTLMLKEDTSILFSSHISSDIEQISDYVSFIHNGHLILKEEKHILTDTWKRARFDRTYDSGRLDDLVVAKLKQDLMCSTIVRDPGNFKAQFASINGKAQIVIDNLTIDDILLHLIKGGMQHA